MGGVCVLAFLAVTAVSAQQSGPTGPTGPARHDAPHRVHPHAFVGEVVTVNVAAGTFTGREALRDGSPKTTTFHVDGKSRIMRGRDSCKLSDIHSYDHVTVKYAEETGGRHRAMTVSVTPALVGGEPKPAESPAPR